MLAFHRFSHTLISSYYSSYNQKVPALFLQIKQEPQKNMEYFLTQQPQEKQALSEKDLHLPSRDRLASTWE